MQTPNEIAAAILAQTSGADHHPQLQAEIRAMLPDPKPLADSEIVLFSEKQYLRMAIRIPSEPVILLFAHSKLILGPHLLMYLPDGWK